MVFDEGKDLKLFYDNFLLRPGSALEKESPPEL